jgi:endoglycosylceramidase
MAGEFDIWVLLDAHQDLFSSKFCGEGAPAWTVTDEQAKSFPSPLGIKIERDPYGNPTRQSCSQVEFASFYLTKAISSYENDLLTNRRELADHLAGAWREVAKAVKDLPNLLGYELLNEPSGPSIYRHPVSFATPGAANKRFLLPFYRRLAAAIR